jgi:hypothetical protein
LTAASTPLAGTEVLPIVQSGATVKVAVSDLTAGRAISATAVTASTGNITSTAGNFVVGTSGQGVDFSATPGTGTSELLADYEEGTWTGTISVNNFSGTTPTSLDGTYTKIGRTVQIKFTLFASGSNFSIGAGVRSDITGLPYSVSAAIAFSVAGTTGVYGDARATGTTITMESIASSAAMFMQFTYQV